MFKKYSNLLTNDASNQVTFDLGLDCAHLYSEYLIDKNKLSKAFSQLNYLLKLDYKNSRTWDALARVYSRAHDQRVSLCEYQDLAEKAVFCAAKSIKYKTR